MPIERVAAFLAAAGYRAVDTPVRVGGMAFEFAAAFIGASRSADLILVADNAVQDARLILRNTEGLARALDILESKRPMTLIIVGPRPNSSTLEAISRVCRVLPVGTMLEDDEEANLRNWLAILLPLELPQPSESIANPIDEIAHRITDLSPSIAELVQVSASGVQAVEARLHELIDEPVREPAQDTD